jgi:hypothetical protein
MPTGEVFSLSDWNMQRTLSEQLAQKGLSLYPQAPGLYWISKVGGGELDPKDMEYIESKGLHRRVKLPTQ